MEKKIQSCKLVGSHGMGFRWPAVPYDLAVLEKEMRDADARECFACGMGPKENIAKAWSLSVASYAFSIYGNLAGVWMMLVYPGDIPSWFYLSTRTVDDYPREMLRATPTGIALAEALTPKRFRSVCFFTDVSYKGAVRWAEKFLHAEPVQEGETKDGRVRTYRINLERGV